MSASLLLDRVRAAGGEVDAHGDKLRVRAPEALPSPLLADLRIHKAEILATLEAADTTRLTSRLAWLRDCIRRARSWADLYSTLADADVAYVNGEISGDDVDSLCEMARQEAPTLPGQPEFYE